MTVHALINSVSYQYASTDGWTACAHELYALSTRYRIICDELSHTPIITKSRDWMIGQIRQLAARGAMAVVLGCTEIELLVQQAHVVDVPVIYSGALHIAAAVDVQTGRRSIEDFLPPIGKTPGAVLQAPKL